MKAYRWLALGTALLITLCEVLVFSSEAAPVPQTQPDGAPATDRNGRCMLGSVGGATSLYWAVANARNPQRVR